ncbi:cytochrome c oxidase subunit 5B, mitochondrial-like [Arctopsyche grandis]|uniref:cytochrome c oxidase subunit 5B, mitochondrial-like n=1 Tax=Arctopsyche grandis TaxID=121162 RepID=UPI00406D7C1C
MSVLRVATQMGAAARRVPALSRCFAYKSFADPMEHATGLEKRELLAIQSGDPDPFNSNIVERTAGTKDQPNLVASAFDSRIVGCICNEDCASVNWMWVHKGTPRRCGCGHWFKLIEKAAI